MEEIRFFRKRSGRLVNFKLQKIADAVGKALVEACAASGKSLDVKAVSTAIAEKVKAVLDDKDSQFFVQPDSMGSRVPHLEGVQDAVVSVLKSSHEDIEGYDANMAELTGRLYADYRKKRDEARKQLKVRSSKDNADVTDKALLLGDSKNVLNGWDRERIVSDLKEHNVDDEIAEKVAKETESALLKTGLSSVSSDLVSEMVNSVMADNGLPIRLAAGKGYIVDKDFVEGLIKEKSVENSNIVGNNPEAVAFDIASNVFKQYALDNVFSKEVAEAHMRGAVHLHDLNFCIRGYCGSHSIEYIKKWGLKGLVNLNTESKPAKTASVLTGHLNTFLASMQAYYAGALGLGYINVFYAPLVTGMDDKQLHQVAQELVFNGSQNAFSRGGQTLFLDFNVHSGVPSYLKDVPAIGPGGKYMVQVFHCGEPFIKELTEVKDEKTGDWDLYLDWGNGHPIRMLHEHEGKQVFENENIERHVMRYGDYAEETARFAEALLEVWKEGDANGHVFEFPKCDFHVSSETFTDARQYQVFRKACEVASHNGSTYFVFDRDSVSLASCCFTGDTRILIGEDRDPSLTCFRDAYDKYGIHNRTIRVYDRGSWRKAKVIRLSGKNRRMVSVNLACGKHVCVTADHEFPTTRGVLKAYELTPDDAVLLSSSVAEGHRRCEGKDKAQVYGIIAGAYLLSGHCTSTGKTIVVGNSLPGLENTFSETMNSALESAGFDKGVGMVEEDGNRQMWVVTNPEILNGVEKLLKRTENGVFLSDAIYRESPAARAAVLIGLIAASTVECEVTPGRMELLLEQIEAMATTIGVICKKRVDGDDVCFSFAPATIGMEGETFVKDGESYLKVLSVKEALESEWVYCFTMLDTKDPFFTLPNGIVTHNCRLKVQITDMSLLQHPERLRTLGFQNVTINIPQCAYRAKHRYDREGEGNIDKLNEFFLAEIDSMMDICKAAHLQKKAFVETLMRPGAPMWQMAKPSNDGNPYLDLNTAVYIIGMIGLNDAVHYLTGEEMHESDAAMDYALNVMTHMYLRSKEYTKETGLTFKLEESPAESAARRLAKADLALYREDALKVFKGTEDAAYYTNSIHLSADAPVSLVERIRKQSMFHSIIESGAITHVFLGEERPSAVAIEELIRNVFLRTQCAQLVFSPEFTYCNDCGREQAGLKDVCDQCGSHNVVGITRVVGYYALVQNFNKSKRYGELPARQRGRYSLKEAK